MFYGLDIGGSKIEIAIFNPDLQIINNWRVDTPTIDYQEFIDAIVTMVCQADAQTGQSGHVGIGLPGVIDANNLLLSANIPCASGKNVSHDLQQRLQRHIVIENDSRCFVLSEAVDGAGIGHNNVFCAIIGTGAAGGLAINGQLYQSRQGIAGEYGHMQLSGLLQQKYNLPVRACGCGLLNCYERFISGPGLQFLYTHFDNANNQQPTAPEIIKRWQQNEAVAVQTMDCYFDLLGACFANLVIVYDPDIIVLGGGLSLINKIGERLNQAIDPYLFGQFSAPPIVGAKYGDASGVRGAALLAKQALSVRATRPNITQNIQLE